jgi:hypothetical protein
MGICSHEHWGVIRDDHLVSEVVDVLNNIRLSGKIDGELSVPLGGFSNEGDV